MRVLILSFSSNQVNADSFVPNKIGLTFSCVAECENVLKSSGNEVEHICINQKNIQRCLACGERGWGICLKQHKCVQEDDFNGIYEYMGNFDGYVFVTPVYFWEMSESAKTFFDRLKRCDAFCENSEIRSKKVVCIACAGGSGSGTEETLQAFDRLNYFLKTQMCGRISVTKANFETQREVMKDAMLEVGK